MAGKKVVQIRDYERRTQRPDDRLRESGPRKSAEVIILPMVRTEPVRPRRNGKSR